MSISRVDLDREIVAHEVTRKELNGALQENSRLKAELSERPAVAEVEALKKEMSALKADLESAKASLKDAPDPKDMDGLRRKLEKLAQAEPKTVVKQVKVARDADRVEIIRLQAENNLLRREAAGNGGGE